MTWNEIRDKALQLVAGRPEYEKLLADELEEIEKQGLNQYWTEIIEKKETWDTNPFGLVLPFLFKLTPVDPVETKIPHKWDYQTDFPDIDTDYLPAAKKIIRDYATKQYKYVCSVGNWNTYGPKSALQDAVRAMGDDLKTIMAITTKLPDEFDELSWEDHLKFFEDQNSADQKVRGEARQEIAKYQEFYNYQRDNPRTVDIAYKLVGKIKSQGTHAGGLIIADRPVEDCVPLSYMGKKTARNWTSQWTEGKNTQLSKFGLVKFDILGVKTLYYIWQAGNLLRKTDKIEIDWEDMDPTTDPPRAGWLIYPDGRKEAISFNDKKSLDMCNDLRTESVFQIETDIQKGIIKDGKVKTYNDLVIYNALGRPGPMDAIPDYIKNRDDEQQLWKKGLDERIVKILGDTYGVISYQEQLASMWRELAGFSAPEAEAARKIIAKKWVDKLPKVEKQWKEGAQKTLGEQAASDWWTRMETFGRYAFNRSHALAYSIITYRCLYLKAHFPAQWWAAVMTECHSEKLRGYMSAARRDGVQFGTLDVNNLTHGFTVDQGCVIPGLKTIKKVGDKASAHFCSIQGPFRDIDEMVQKTGKHKNTYERLIKLGAFDKLCPNRKGLWTWYQYAYASGEDSSAVRKEYNALFAMPQEQVEAERQRQIDAFRREFPKRKVPYKLLNWKPKPKELTKDDIIPLVTDYTPAERILLEKDLLGYYWSSPLDIYDTMGGKTVENAKIEAEGAIIEGVIEGISQKSMKKGGVFYIIHLNDGVQSADVVVWADVFMSTDPKALDVGAGIRLCVDYNEERKGFKISSGSTIIALTKRGKEKEVEKEVALW